MTQRTRTPLPFAAPVTAALSGSATPPAPTPSCALPSAAPVPRSASTPLPFSPAPKAGKREVAVQPSLFAEPAELQESTVLVASIRPNPNLKGRDVIDSVGVVGVLQPILIEPTDDPHYLYRVVAGGRRLHSALHFKLDEIRVMITGGTSAQLALLRAVENGARSPNPVAEARAYQEAMNAGVYASERALAKDMGLDTGLVRKRLNLAGLPGDILEAVDAGMLSCPNAERIVNLRGEYRSRALSDVRAALAEGRKFTGDDLKNVKTRQKGDMGAALSGLLGALPAGALQPLLTLSPAQLLAEEFRAIAQERGVDLAEVVALLSGGALPAPGSMPAVPVATSAAAQVPPLPGSPAPAPRTAAAPPFAQGHAPVTSTAPTPPASAEHAPEEALVTAPVTRKPLPFSAAPAATPVTTAVQAGTADTGQVAAPEVELDAPQATAPADWHPVTGPAEQAAAQDAPDFQDAPAPVAAPAPEPLDDGNGVQTSALLAVSAPAAPLGLGGLLGTAREGGEEETLGEMPWPGFEETASVPEARGPSLDELSDGPVEGRPTMLTEVVPPHAPLQAQPALNSLSAAVDPATALTRTEMETEAGSGGEPGQPGTPALFGGLLGVTVDEIQSAPASEDDLPWPTAGSPDAVQAAQAEHARDLAAASEDFSPEFIPFIEKGDERDDDDGTVLRRVPGRINLHAAALHAAGRPQHTGQHGAGSQGAGPAGRVNLIPRR